MYTLKSLEGEGFMHLQKRVFKINGLRKGQKGSSFPAFLVQRGAL